MDCKSSFKRKSYSETLYYVDVIVVGSEVYSQLLDLENCPFQVASLLPQKNIALCFPLIGRSSVAYRDPTTSLL